MSTQRGFMKCNYFKCPNTSKNSNCSFFQFPVNDKEADNEMYDKRYDSGLDRYEDWLYRCNASEELWKLPKHLLGNRRICSAHFLGNDFKCGRSKRLRRDAVPIRFTDVPASRTELSATETSDENEPVSAVNNGVGKETSKMEISGCRLDNPYSNLKIKSTSLVNKKRESSKQIFNSSSDSIWSDCEFRPVGTVKNVYSKKRKFSTLL